MKNKKTVNNKRINKKKFVRKEKYIPPKATFIPLKIEERLMYCNKEEGYGCIPTKFS